LNADKHANAVVDATDNLIINLDPCGADTLY
jgi:hypothetical protein